LLLLHGYFGPWSLQVTGVGRCGYNDGFTSRITKMMRLSHPRLYPNGGEKLFVGFGVMGAATCTR